MVGLSLSGKRHPDADDVKRPRGRPLACAAGAGLVSLAAGGVLSWATILFIRFTPVYHSLHCVPKAGVWHHPEIGDGGISLHGGLAPECTSRNSYDVGFATASAGRVLLLPLDGGLNESEFEEIGTASILPSVVPGGGVGALQAALNVSVPMSLALRVIAAGGPVRAVMELNVEAIADIHLLGRSFGFGAKRREVCGLSLLLLLPPERPKLGPSLCAGSLEELVIPPLNASHGLPFSLSVNPKALGRATLKKNVFLGVVVCLSAALCVAGLVVHVRHLRELISQDPGEGEWSEKDARELELSKAATEAQADVEASSSPASAAAVVDESPLSRRRWGAGTPTPAASAAAGQRSPGHLDV